MTPKPFIFLLSTMPVLCLVGADARADWVGTAFTYQGQLKLAGAPMSGIVGMRFTLWNASEEGDSLGSIEFGGVNVVNGVFTVPLDFGADAFDGMNRWLGVSVRYPAGEGPYVALVPRQRIAPVPYALALPGLRTRQGDVSPNVIAGWESNVITEGLSGATISGGGGIAAFAESLPNRVTDNYSTVGGGIGNTAGDDDANALSSAYATVGGGYDNQAANRYATVAGGDRCTASGLAASAGGGRLSRATARSATVAGGEYNSATADHATVAGGNDNHATGRWATIAGGAYNDAGGEFSFAGGQRATVRDATASGDADGDEGTFVWSDSTLTYPDRFISTGPDQFLINAAGGVGIGTNAPSNALSVAGSADFGGNVGIGTTEPTHPLQIVETQLGALTYAQHISNRGEAVDTAVGVLFQVAGGTLRGKGAIAYELSGSWNRGDFHILQNNSASPDVASLDDAVVTVKNNGRVGIGTSAPRTNLDVTGSDANIVGVNIKNASTDQQYLLQVNGSALDGASRAGNLEIWATGPDGNYNVFTAAPNGNVGLRQETPAYPLQVGTNSQNGNGAHLTAGGVWTNGSDRNSKCRFEHVDKKAILEQVVDLSVTKWQYKGEAEHIRHIGPTAQDFYAAFSLGESDKHIGTVDADGVALVAIQGLYEMISRKDAEIASQQEEITGLKARLERIEAMLDAALSSSKRPTERHRG